MIFRGSRRNPVGIGVTASALILGALVLSGPQAGATGGPNATQATITCDAFLGTATFSPALQPAPSADQKVSISGTLSSCAAQGVAATVSSGTIKASATFSLTSQGPDLCENLTDFGEFPSKSSGKIVWSTRLSSGDTDFKISPISFGIDGSNDFSIGLHFASPTGSFQGPNHGEYDTFGADGPSLSKAGTKCAKAGGIKSVSLKTPDFSPLLSLGGPNPE